VEATSFARAVSSAEEHLILPRSFAGVDHVTLIILYRGYEVQYDDFKSMDSSWQRHDVE